MKKLSMAALDMKRGAQNTEPKNAIAQAIETAGELGEAGAKAVSGVAATTTGSAKMVVKDPIK